MIKQSHKGQKLIQILLLLISCGLVYQLWVETNRESFRIEAISDSGQKETLTDPGAIITENQFPPMSDFEEITARPLFFDDRQPYVDTEQVKESPPDTSKSQPATRKQPADFVLSAVTITPEQQLAVIQNGKNKQQQTITLGETIDGWTLKSVEYDSVTLTMDDETLILDLEIKGSLQKTRVPAKTPVQKARPGSRQEQIQMIKNLPDTIMQELERDLDVEKQNTN